MQSDHDENDWQQPTTQPSQAPYVANQPDTQPSAPVQPAPVVTINPDPTPVLQSDAAPVIADEESPVHWQAHEYIHHDKNAGWFVLFAIVVVALTAIAIFLIQSITFAILVPVMAAALLVYTHRPPRLIDYTLSRQGLHINDQLNPFTEFKSFGVIHDGDAYFVMLIPVKRFKPGVSVYFPEESGEAIVDMLGARLPMEELHLDIVDQIIRKLRI
jgi:hypothetical protein